jgi:hypothetical protein
MMSLWKSATEGLAQYPDKDKRLALSRERLFASVTSGQGNEFHWSQYHDRETDRRFFETCVLLEEFTKEVVSSLEVGTWMVGGSLDNLHLQKA